jgi:hypothetical protein
VVGPKAVAPAVVIDPAPALRDPTVAVHQSAMSIDLHAQDLFNVKEHD